MIYPSLVRLFIERNIYLLHNFVDAYDDYLFVKGKLR